MKQHNMIYNSQLARLVIPEYGRNIQELIMHGKSIEGTDERQAFIEKVIDLMMQMHPQNRNMDDYREKLWQHVFQIAGYDLDVKPPEGVVPSPENERKKPEQVSYPASEARFRHYGNNVQQLINKAIAMEDGPIKNGFIEVIGSYMKLAYRTWNKDHYVSDETIKENLKSLSKGKLVLAENMEIDNLSNANRRKKRDNKDRYDRNDRNDRHKGRKKGRRR